MRGRPIQSALVIELREETSKSTVPCGLLIWPLKAKDWDRRAEGKLAMQICVLGLETGTAGLRPRHIPVATSARQYVGPRTPSVTRTAKAAATRLVKGPVWKLTQHDIDEIKRLHAEGRSFRQIAQRHLVSHQTINRVHKATYGAPN